MKKWVFILLISFWVIPSSLAQIKTYSFEQAEKLSKENPKPIVVFIHTSWCKNCNMMEKSTFIHQEIIAHLNQNFYFVSLDAESKENITFNNHTFEFKPNGQNTGVHELAFALATINSQVVYPTLTILQSDLSILFQLTSFVNAKDLLMVLEKLK